MTWENFLNFWRCRRRCPLVKDCDEAHQKLLASLAKLDRAIDDVAQNPKDPPKHE